jgi:hypothetical protein
VIWCEYLFFDAVDFDNEIFLAVSISKSYNHHNCIWLFLFQYHRWFWDEEVFLLLVLRKSVKPVMMVLMSLPMLAFTAANGYWVFA